MKQQTLNFSDGQHIVHYEPSVVGFAVQGLQRAKENNRPPCNRKVSDLRIQGRAGKLRVTSVPKR
jgi:hypothetical protein